MKSNYFIRDITILSGELEIENILTIGDIFDYNLSWDFEEREEGRQYPGIGRKRFSKNFSVLSKTSKAIKSYR